MRHRLPKSGLWRLFANGPPAPSRTHFPRTSAGPLTAPCQSGRSWRTATALRPRNGGTQVRRVHERHFARPGHKGRHQADVLRRSDPELPPASPSVGPINTPVRPRFSSPDEPPESEFGQLTLSGSPSQQLPGPPAHGEPTCHTPGVGCLLERLQGRQPRYPAGTGPRCRGRPSVRCHLVVRSTPGRDAASPAPTRRSAVGRRRTKFPPNRTPQDGADDGPTLRS